MAFKDFFNNLVGVGRGGQPGGRMGGPQAGGPGGTCVCTNPECGHEMAHERAEPCSAIECPQCGSPMTRKE